MAKDYEQCHTHNNLRNGYANRFIESDQNMTGKEEPLRWFVFHAPVTGSWPDSHQPGSSFTGSVRWFELWVRPLANPSRLFRDGSSKLFVLWHRWERLRRRCLLPDVSVDGCHCSSHTAAGTKIASPGKTWSRLKITPVFPFARDGLYESSLDSAIRLK